MVKIKSTVLFIFMLFLMVTILPAEEKDFAVSVNTAADWMFGFNSYGIGWNFTDVANNTTSLGFKISELVFPLNILMVGGDIYATLFKNFKINLYFRKNITSEPGKLKDSDWGVWYLDGNPWATSSTLDVYSTSDTNLIVYYIDSEILYSVKLSSLFMIDFGLGFLYEQFYYEASNVDQWYPSYETYQAYLDPSYGLNENISGLVGTYEIMHFIPLLVIASRFKASDFFQMSLTVSGTPYLIAVDTDYHVLRSKRSNSECYGWAIKSKLSVFFHFSSNVYAGISGDFLYLDAAGNQSQYRYNDTIEGPAGSLGTIDVKLNTFRLSGGVYIGLSF
ncbi:MAG: hypothetical protein JW737_09760 [Acidobacteria bacterium]|nr:hypothetical protein [Acidobacteriota bacterium]